jgi:hypothetical protein
MPSAAANDKFGVRCPPDMPAIDPQSAAWPSLRSKHVDTSNAIDDDANTGECELCA